MISKDPSEPLKSGISEYDFHCFLFLLAGTESVFLYGRGTTTRTVLSCIENWFRTTLAERLEESSHPPECFYPQHRDRNPALWDPVSSASLPQPQPC